MDHAQVEEALGELEMRVERLRSLYEQYFMGIEKIEPTVLRKDVDRRLWHLRREQIRNTALRFKLNTINQRYNTYQQYWQRICREIENGTYMRHLKRAESRFGTEALTIAARKRGRRQARDEQALQQRASETPQAPQQEPDLDGFDVDVDIDVDFAPPSRAKPDAGPAQKPKPRSARAVHDLDDLESVMDLSGPRNPLEPAPNRPAASALNRLDDLEAVVGLHASLLRGAGGSQRLGSLDEVFEEGDGDATQPHRSPFARGSVAPPRPPPPRSPPPQPSAPPRPQPSAPPRPQPSAPPRPQPSAPPRPQFSTPRRPPARPPNQATNAPAPRAPTTPAPGPSRSPEPPRPQPSALATSRRPQPSPSPAKPAAASTGGDALSEARVRQIYQEYVRAKRQCNESTSTITEDGLGSTLRKSAEQLRAKHRGRQVDFDVVIKDGRAVLKPVVKS